MRIIAILFFLFAITSKDAISQATQKKVASSNRATPAKNEIPSKNQIQSEMNEATNEIVKEIADLEKQLKTETDEETIKDLKDQIEMLKKQLKMMQGLNKNLSMMSDKVVEEAVEDDGSATVPKRDMTRISMLPKKILTEAEMLLFIKKIQLEVEKIIAPSEKADALKMYNETKAEYKSVAIIANAASGCWMAGNWEKALFIMGKACVDDVEDADNLNNYAAFLIDAGAEQAAIPILEYLNTKYPDNSTILNNIGQAWFGLGDLENSEKFLNAAIELYPNHSTANLTMAGIAMAGPNPDTPRAINFLKASLKENYDSEKESELEKLGYTITLEDMPELKYPMKSDPVGILEFVETFPEEYPSRIGDDDKVTAVNRYYFGINKLKDEYNDEQVMLQKKIDAHAKIITVNSQYRNEYLEPHHNSPVYKVASRSHSLIIQKKTGKATNAKPVREVWEECLDIWEQNVAKPIAKLATAWQNSKIGASCTDIDAATNAYLAQVSAIKKKGTKMIKDKVQQNSSSIDEWLKIVLYSGMGNPPKDKTQLTMDLVSQLDFTMTRKSYRDGEIFYIMDMAQKFIDRQNSLKSACDQTGNYQDDPDLTALTGSVPTFNIFKRDLKCEFVKVMKSVYVMYRFECNAMNETIKAPLKSKKDPVKKGKGYSGKGKSSSKGRPLHGGKGPFVNYDDIPDFEVLNFSSAPLSAEDEDLSQFSIEYDSWGNLSGLNVRLNKDGTSLADPDSVESGVDSRWSWNAIASPKKGFLNKLIIK